MGGPTRTDHMPLEEFQRRARAEKRAGIRAGVKEPFKLAVVFDPDFDIFAASVAAELRRRITYRSDGGVFARGLVRATLQLKAIHTRFRTTPVPKGQRVRIDARLYRRDDSDPTKRYAMAVQFANPGHFDQDEGEIVTPRPDVSADLERKYAFDLLDVITDLTQSSWWNPPNGWGKDQVKHIRDWVHLAHRVGYPAFKNLWYYNANAVGRYVQVQTSEPTRKDMTMASGGKTPFSGNTGSPMPEEWRIFPFQELLTVCKPHANKLEECRNTIGRHLWETEGRIDTSMGKINLSKDQHAQLTSGALGGSLKDSYPRLDEFFKHMADLANSPLTLYFPYK